MMDFRFFDIIEEATALPVPVKLEPLVQALGIALDKKAELPADVAGLIERQENGDYKISVNQQDHYFRQRFTIAHELGHFLFHQDLIGQGIQDNRLYRSVNPQVTEEHEVEANRFATSLIMPYRHVTRDYEVLDKDVKKVATKWQVSPKAMKIRLGLPVD